MSQSSPRACPSHKAGFGLIQSCSPHIFKGSIQRASSVPRPAGEQHCFSSLCSTDSQHGLLLLSAPCSLVPSGSTASTQDHMSCHEKREVDPEHAGVSEAHHRNMEKTNPLSSIYIYLSAGFDTALGHAPGLDSPLLNPVHF